MLMRSDPFRDLDRLTEQALRGGGRPPMPMDAYRKGEEVVVHLDLPGVEASSIDLTVERNVLNVTAERSWSEDDGAQVIVSERPQGSFSRQLFLGESLDTEAVEADYLDGVLTIRVPVSEKAKARRVEVNAGGGTGEAITATATES